MTAMRLEASLERSRDFDLMCHNRLSKPMNGGKEVGTFSSWKCLRSSRIAHDTIGEIVNYRCPISNS